MVDIRQSVQYANYLSKIGWIAERTTEINYFIKKVPIIGSVLKIQRPDEIRINKIREISKKYRAFQIIIEPKTQLDADYLSSIGFRLSKSPYLPTKTLQLDLTQSEKKLLGHFKKDARRAVRRTNTPMAVEQENIEKFRNSWKRSVRLKHYVPPLAHLKALKKSFKGNCLFITIQRCVSVNQPQAGGIFLMADSIAYYWQAFTNSEGRRNLSQYRIVWEGIKWAKKRGAKIFDFEGIYDERFPNKSWKGFSHFKKSFGGYEVSYPGCFVKTRLFTF